MKKYLVAGGAGFIGSNIVKRLLELGESVRVIDNFSTGKRENIKEFLGNPNFELIEGDLINLGIARKAVKGMDFVLHQAAIPSVSSSISNPLKSNNSNIVATLNLLIASREEKVKKFVYASSCAVYGNNSRPTQKEDSPVNPLSPYALTKYTGEKYAQFFWQIYKLPTLSLRYFNVFGPKQDPHSQYVAVIPKFITSLLKKGEPIIYGTGEQSRDFVFVDNVVEANLLAAKSKKGFGEIFNIAYGKEISINQLLQSLQKIIGVEEIKPRYLKSQPNDIFCSKADISKAKKMLNYTPKIRFEKGLKMTIEWFYKN